MTLRTLFNLALWGAGTAHFLLLGVGSQVPRVFDWQRELSRLSRHNQRHIRVYWAFTGLSILAFGVLTLVLHDELVRGDRAALGLAAYIGCFWLARVGVDVFYFDHADWPKGRMFVLTHVLLTLCFACLVTTYSGLVVWHLAGGGS